MNHFCPAYPKPRPTRASRALLFLSARHSWLDALYERSYAMHMGEVHLPGLGGIEMARLIRERDPRAVTVLMSADQQDVLRVRQAGLGPTMTTSSAG